MPILLVLSIAFGMLPMGVAQAHEPIIYGPDGAPIVAQSGPAEVSPMGTQMITTVQEVIPTDRAGRAVNDDPCFDVSGQIVRVERTPTNAGGGSYLADTTAPVRFARLELREEDPISDDSYGEVYTSSNGSYSFHFCDDDGIGGGALELYLRLYTDVYDPATKHRVVYVEDSSYVDEIYEYDSAIFGNANGGTFTINMNLTVSQSQPFNITDGIYEAWVFFNNSGGVAASGEKLDLTAEVHWEPGYKESANTFYEPVFEEITIGTVTDPDAWDESSFIHEYGHFIEDNYSCDESLGGSHSFDEILDDEEFAWSEGYNDYFQGAVRAGRGYPEANVYLDPGTNIDLEAWDMNFPASVSSYNEMSIAALFWDLLDTTNDGQDRVSTGHSDIQQVYTDDEFNDQWFDEECTVPEYFRAWQALKKQSDADVAAVIVQNTGVGNPFTTSAVSAASADGETSAYSFTDLAANAKSTAYQWWKHLVMISDVSKSMQGTKLNAVKTVLNEQVADIAKTHTKGTEFSLYTFDNTKTTNNTLLAGKFYPELVTPAINSLAANSANDPTCQVESLRAMSQAIGPKNKGDLWLFTDGDALQSISVETLVKALNSRQMRGSFAVMGGCNSATPDPKSVSGAAKNYLGLGANATQPGGIVPYLLTALGSGGKFLFVDPNQTQSAANILRAQLTHSAGAGTWSDYVSNNATYIYDKLNSWEYSWIDTTTAGGGINQGVPNPSVAVQLPGAFPFYGTNQNLAHVNRYGYLTFGASPQTAQLNNTAIPNPAQPNTALYVLWEELFWNNPPTAAASATGNTPDSADALQVDVSTKSQGDWFAISTIGNRTTNSSAKRSYQILLNATTGEIRYQYKEGIDASGATIGMENPTGTVATQISLNDINGAKDSMGYKFVPAPVQPSKTFTVAVDGLTSSVGFLLTGYSGNFAPLAVRTPDNGLVSCADTANVLCITAGLVQYVQVKVNGRKGNWRATVAPGNTGAGTFTFSAIGASTVNASSGSERSLAVGPQFIGVKLDNDSPGAPRSTQNGQLTGWFATVDGKPFGSPFPLYDDGLHNDDGPNDGRFGSDAFTPPGPGVAYLWMQGTVNGEAFSRSDPAPFNFQPLEVTSLGDGVNDGDVTALTFTIKNGDTAAHCYNRSTEVPSGWTFDWKLSAFEANFGLCMAAGATVTRTVEIKMAALSPNTLPSGATGDVIVTFVDKEEGSISHSATASVTRRRTPAYIVLDNRNSAGNLRPNGKDTAALKIQAFDEQMVSVAEGTPVTITTSIGMISPTHASIQNGKVDATFTTPQMPGTALLSIAVAHLSMTTTLEIAGPLPDKLTLISGQSVLSPTVLTTPLTVTVTDKWGDPAVGQSVRLGVSGDGGKGTIGGSEVVTGTTNSAGQFVATFDRSGAIGEASVTATLMFDQNGQLQPSLSDTKAIQMLAEMRSLFLPQVNR
ncbi:MAG: hypothetical protein KJZ86_07850 [Caldilineaceae bacterium]|nr:hypothetical protein [Caldilineaceae bacterium]